MTSKNTIVCSLIIASATAFLSGCDHGLDVEGGGELVVEGWIDSGQYPVVKLTRTVSVGSEYQSTDNLEDCVEQWARVTVSDGGREVTLIGHRDDSHFPPYVYTTSDMLGVPGRTYTLTVDCLDGTHAEAQTTIPQPAAIDSFAIERVSVADTLRQVYAYVRDDGTKDGGYKLFTYVYGEEKGFMSAYLGISAADRLPDGRRMAVSRGRQSSATRGSLPMAIIEISSGIRSPRFRNPQAAWSATLSPQTTSAVGRAASTRSSSRCDSSPPELWKCPTGNGSIPLSFAKAG